MARWLVFAAFGLLVAACGDDASNPTDGGVRPGDTGIDSDGGTVADAGRVDAGRDAGPPPPDIPCAEGTITALCNCGGEGHATGYCCSDLWFDPYYEVLTGGCPMADGFRHVDPDHATASDGNPGTEEMPWATIEHGVATVTAGQVLVVRAGVYSVAGTGSRYTPALNPGHSGTAGSPVILKADGEVVVEPAVVHSGTARGGSPETIVLADTASSMDQAYVGHYVRVVGGTGAGQSRPVLRDFDALARTSYEGASRTAWVNLDVDGHGNWETVPDATSEYELIRTGPLVGTLERQHVVWDGFHVVERDSYHPDTGPVVLWASDHVVLMGSEVEAMTGLLFDNHNAVRINGSTNVVVRNNRLHGVQPIELGRNNPQNHAAIMIYTSENALIEHNEIYDSYSCVFPKGGDRGHEIRFNELHDCAKAFRISYHENVRIWGNLVRDSGIAFQGSENNTGVRIFNNTVHSGNSGLYNWFAIDGVDLFNNVFSQVTYPVLCEGAAGAFTERFNAFHAMDDLRIDNRNVGGLSAWQAAGYGVGSIEIGAPFVDAAGGDYHLVAGSPAASAGRDIEDLDEDGDRDEAITMGAYVMEGQIVGLLPER